MNWSHQRARWLEFYQIATQSDVQLAVLFSYFCISNVKVHETMTFVKHVRAVPDYYVMNLKVLIRIQDI